MGRELPEFEQVVFSGGGTRCFWQGGFLDVVREAIGLNPLRVATVSGGALAGAAFITHRGHELLDAMTDAFARNDENVSWDDLNSDDGLTPHQRIYRQVVQEVIDAGARDRIASGPVFQVLLGHPPADSRSRAAGVAATAAYEAELHLIGAPDFDWPTAIGVDATLVDGREAALSGDLTRLLCAAATIPPLFDMARWNDRPVIDGGMASQAPMPDPDEGATLILLTRAYRRLPDDPRLTHVWPSEGTPADKIDFTDPDKIRKTWDLGQEDGRAFLRSHDIH